MELSPRFFNTSGPCDPEIHYMLPPGRRLPELQRLVQERKYFVIHAARQTGKTTSMRALAQELRADGRVALHVSLESSRHEPRLELVEPRWLEAISQAALIDLPAAERPESPEGMSAPAGSRLQRYITTWCLALQPRPLVLLLDEVDTIEGPAMVSFLAQLRSGFNQRPRGFPASVALVGMRDLKDYLVEAKGGMPPNPGSPFNIKDTSLTLRNFDRTEVAELYAQHTSDTGQAFAEASVDRVFYWTRGQPFLVNALAYHLTRTDPVPPGRAINDEDIDRAKEHLVLSRTTHLHNLVHRLQEPRVAEIMRPILLGEGRAERSDLDDIDYCFDLGLLARGPLGLEPANPLYREVLARELARSTQDQLPLPWWPWQTAEGRLDFPALVAAFFPWWRRHGEVLVEGTDAGWREAAGHLIFMGFLQRVVNGGGEVEREYASGRGRLDLLVRYGPDRFAVELKRVPPRGVSLETIREEGVAQLAGYLSTLGLEEGWMIVFDQRPGLSWEERLWTEELIVEGRLIHLRGG